MQLSNSKSGERVSIMHGENWLQPVDSLPEGKTTKTKLYVAGHSETGHHHVLESKQDMEVLEENGERYVLINEVAQLFHKKSFDVHETVTVEPGVYRITHKNEYDPFTKVIRRVFD